MGKTRHFQQRMSQRGMTLEIVELARRFGEPNQDKVILGCKGLAQLLAAVRDIERVVLKALDKGGIVVVEDGDSLITTYRLDSYNKKKISAFERRAT